MFLRRFCGFALIVALAAVCAGQSAPAAQQGGQTNVPASTTGMSSPATMNTPAVSSAATSGAPAANTPAAGANGGTTTPSAGSSMPGASSTATAGAARTRTADRDPLLDLPALPKGKVALQGGTLIQVDPVRDRLVMRPFGQRKKEEFAFDVRTQFTRDGKSIAVRDLRPGSQIYADTIWDGQKVFAKSVRIFTGSYQDQEHGQILAFDPGSGSLRVRDELFPDPVDLKVGQDTVIRKDQSPGSVADLRPGALVALKFQPGSRGQVYQVDVLATPGAQFVFSGPITHIDLLRHVIGISNRSDSVIYDLHFDPEQVKITPQLQEGADVDVNATFDGTKYFANTIVIRSARESQ
jgi:hypothetical protein